MQETWVWSLGREDPTWGGATEAREPQLRSSGARELQLLKPQGELRRRSRWPGKPTHHSEGGPSSPQLETARAQHEDGAQPSINKQIKSHAKTVCRVIANLIWLMSLWEEIGTHQGTCKHRRKATEGHHAWEGGHLEAGDGPQEKPTWGLLCIYHRASRPMRK